MVSSPYSSSQQATTDDGTELEVPSDEPQTDERCRSIERGAKIVTVMPTTYSVVLQMPRGNLETIYPRALVLAAIRRSIENDSYSEAFLACRNQRVDMNILHDHDPERFMSSIERIITQIKRIEHIDLLLSQLR
jgi:elongator complex protein 1